MPYRHDDSDNLDEAEFPEADDGDDNDGTVACPACRRPVFEQAEWCPHCENYISQEDAPSRQPWWIVAGVVVCLGVIVFGIWYGFW
jgi:hypothetical protein